MFPRKTIKLLIFLLICMVLTTSGCSPPAPTQGNTSIGTVTRVSDTVEKNNNRVSTSNQLFQNDAVGLLNGGEGLLDFGGALILRLFNDTQVGGVKAATDPNSSVLVRLRLRLGGFTGKLNIPGKQAVFETPNGATITVSGTDFFLVYDPEQDLASAGNFNGDMEIESGGSGPIAIPPGTLRQAQGNNPPSPEAEIPFGKSGFEDFAREFGSPVAVVNERIPRAGEPLDPNPPEIEVHQFEPDMLLIGPECPNAPNVVRVTYTIFEENEIDDTAIEWRLGEQRGTAPVEKIDDQTFIGTVGPVDMTGTLIMIVEAKDEFGNIGKSNQLEVQVENCIG